MHFIDKLEAEASPAVDTTDTWKWTFADLWVQYKKHLENERRDREISEDNFKIKLATQKQHLKLIVDGEPLAKMRVADLTKGKVENQVVKQLKVGMTKKLSAII